MQGHRRQVTNGPPFTSSVLRSDNVASGREEGEGDLVGSGTIPHADIDERGITGDSAA
ncbi:MAG: hypothetical protein ACYC10_06075 [Allorhizobium sp.]